MMATASKVTSDPLRRQAYLYVRQSSLQQVHDHRESTARQYDRNGGPTPSAGRWIRSS
jgi:hypothetical protein